jgi:hypothetical protein
MMSWMAMARRTLSSGGVVMASVPASVYDARGVLVLHGSVPQQAGMEMSTLPPGFYSIVLYADQYRIIHLKWIKE